MFEFKPVFEEGNNKCRQSALGTEPAQKEFGPGWLNTAAKGNYRQVEKLSGVEKLSEMEKSKLARESNVVDDKK